MCNFACYYLAALLKIVVFFADAKTSPGYQKGIYPIIIF